MNRVNRRIMGVIAAAAAVAVSGCQTTGGVGDHVAGAGIGAAVGCGVGALVRGDSKGCAVGAAVGAAAGLAYVAINHYEAKQVRSSEADRRVYGVTKPVNNTQVKIRESENNPTAVRHGERLDITTDYSLLLPPGQSTAAVTESWVVKQKGEEVVALAPKRGTRGDGGQLATLDIIIPEDLPPGTYQVEHKVQAGSSYDTDTSTFVVRA